MPGLNGDEQTEAEVARVKSREPTDVTCLVSRIKVIWEELGPLGGGRYFWYVTISGVFTPLYWPLSLEGRVSH
jgi:hypothetical protein